MISKIAFNRQKGGCHFHAMQIPAIIAVFIKHPDSQTSFPGSDDILFHCIWTRRIPWRISVNKSYSVSCSSIFGFYSGSDALGALQCLSGRPFPEVPAGQIWTRACFMPTEHLNLGHCCWNSCNTLTFSALGAWIYILAEFRYSCLSLHLNAEDSLANLCK